MIPFGALQVYAKGKDSGDSMLSGFGSRRMCMLTAAQKRTFITTRALAASPLFMGGELTMTPSEDYALITNEQILKCCKNGVTGRRIYMANYIDVRKTPQKDCRQKGWIGVFNRFTTPKVARLSCAQLQIDANAKLYDIWNKKPMEQRNGSVEIKLDADDVCFMRYE